MLGGDGDDLCTATPTPASSPCPREGVPGRRHRNFASGGDDYLDGGDGNDTIVGDALNFSSFRSAASRTAAAAPTP